MIPFVDKKRLYIFIWTQIFPRGCSKELTVVAFGEGSGEAGYDMPLKVSLILFV